MPIRPASLQPCCANSPDPAAMLTFNGNLKVYVAREPCDMRKSFKRLEKGTFSWPKDIDGDRINLRDGLQRPWYELR
jgi:hypothetical protein